MNGEERKLIADLFERVRGAETAYRDPEAEAFIGEQIARQPHAPYAMAQTIVMQNQGLEAAQRKIEVLEAELAEARAAQERAEPSPWGPRAAAATGAGGGFLGGMFGRGDRQGEPEPLAYGQRPAYAPQTGQGAQAGYGQQPYAQAQPSRGGGFLSGALQTAAGVAGGALLFSGIQSMFGGGAAEAAAPKPVEEPAKVAEAPAEDTTPDAGDDTGDSGGGGWFSGLTGSNASFDGGDEPSGGDDDWA